MLTRAHGGAILIDENRHGLQWRDAPVACGAHKAPDDRFVPWNAWETPAGNDSCALIAARRGRNGTLQALLPYSPR